MAKHKTIWGGPSGPGGVFGIKSKLEPFPNISPGTPRSPRNELPFFANGYVLPDVASTDLHMVADDVSNGQNWSSRASAYTALLAGQPSVGNESPFYTNGLFNGTGFRKGITQFDGGNYYAFPYNVNHVITASQSITYEFIARAPHVTNTQTILSSYQFPNHNIDIKFENLFGTWYVTAFMNMSITSCYAFQEVHPYAYSFIHVIWNAPTTTLYIGVNGYFSSSVGAGTTLGTSPAGLFIGLNGDGSTGLVNGHILEIMRHRYSMPQSVAADRINKFAGMRSTTGDLPISFSRGTKCNLLVNNKLWAFDFHLPCINENGLLLENSGGSLFAANYFDQDLAFLYSSTASNLGSGGSSLTRYTDSDSFADVGGTGAKFTYDAVINTAYVLYASSIQYPASYKINMDIWIKALNSGAKCCLQIYCLETSKYYNPDTNTWSVSPTNYPVGTGITTKEKFSFSITFEAVASTLWLVFTGAEFPTNANKSFVIYGFDESKGGYHQSTSVNYATPQAVAFTQLYYDKFFVNLAKDYITFDIKYWGSSSQLPFSYLNRMVFADDAGFLQMDVGTNNLRLSDAIGDTVLMTGQVYSSLQKVSYLIKWDKSVLQSMTLSNQTQPLSISGDCVYDIDNGASYFYIGCDNASNNQLDGFIRNIKFYDIP